MENKLFIPVILGTNREGRASEPVARFVYGKMEEHSVIETKLFDVADFAMPQKEYGQALKDRFPEYRDAISRADGLVIVSPEYNHGYSGILKSVLDLLLTEYVHKAVGIVGVSAGPWGGTRVIEALVHVVRELGLVVSSQDLNFPYVGKVFDGEGNLIDEAYHERVNAFLGELVWLAEVLRQGREKKNS